MSLAYPSSTSFLDRYLSDSVAKVAMPKEEDEASTLGQPEFLELDPKGGPQTCFPLPALMKALKEDL